MLKHNMVWKWIFLIMLCMPIVFADSLMTNTEMNSINNSLLTTSESRISLIFPVLLLVISIICVMIDFGAIGVILGSMGSMVIITMLGLIVISPASVVSFLLLGGLLLYKVAS